MTYEGTQVGAFDRPTKYDAYLWQVQRWKAPRDPSSNRQVAGTESLQKQLHQLRHARPDSQQIISEVGKHFLDPFVRLISKDHLETILKVFNLK